jgi:hypothetical protein
MRKAAARRSFLPSSSIVADQRNTGRHGKTAALELGRGGSKRTSLDARRFFGFIEGRKQAG